MEILAVATVLDLLFGEPGFFPHPVVLMGVLISFLDKKVRLYTRTDFQEKVGGVLLALIVIGISYFMTLLIIRLVLSVNFIFAQLVKVFILYLTLACRDLAARGGRIFRALLGGDLPAARGELAQIVGRDTERMDKKEIIRAVIETVAENTSDGIIAPVFFYLVGGVPLAVAYKAVNTLDSMLGYRNSRYINLGWASARIDDIFNYIPARLTGILFCLMSPLNGGGLESIKNSLIIMIRDGRSHPSINAGYPEAAAAGALGVRLGGLNYYQGRAEFRPYLGNNQRSLRIEDIKMMNKMMLAGLLALYLVLFLVKYLIIPGLI